MPDEPGTSTGTPTPHSRITMAFLTACQSSMSCWEGTRDGREISDRQGLCMIELPSVVTYAWPVETSAGECSEEVFRVASAQVSETTRPWARGIQPRIRADWEQLGGSARQPDLRDQRETPDPDPVGLNDHDTAVSKVALNRREVSLAACSP